MFDQVGPYIRNQVPVERISSGQDVKNLKVKSKSWTTGVVFINEQFCYGVDFRFSKTPQTMIFCIDRLFSNYQFQQMAGRAQRDRERAQCTVYYNVASESATGIGVEIAKQDKRPFLDGD